MAFRRLARVIDRHGVEGRLHQVTLDTAHRPFARVRLADGAHVSVPFELLQHEDNGGYHLPASWGDFTSRTDTVTTIPVVEERVQVDVRPAPERTLRIRRRVVSEPQVVETPMWHERIEVERVAVDQLVDEMPSPREDGDVLIIPCVEEVVVVEKRLRVREELRVRIVREQRIHRETVQLRRHEIEIDSAEQPVPKHPNKPRGV